MRELTDDEIVAVRKETPSNYSRPWGDTLAFARAILAAAQAAMPPREPTRAMIAAAVSATGDTPDDGRIMARVIWRAMYDAWTQEQTSGKAADSTVYTPPDDAGTPGPLDHQSTVIPHEVKEGSRKHVLSYSTAGIQCSEPRCEINQSAATPSKPDVSDSAGVADARPADGSAADPIAALCVRLRKRRLADAAHALERLARELDELDTVLRNRERNLADALNERDALRAYAERWQHFASLPQTALMLGTNLDPNDTTVDWLVECNRLADAAIDSARAEWRGK